MRATSLCAIAMMMATQVGCSETQSAPGRITLTTADPATGIAGQYTSSRYGTYSFRSGRDAGALGVAELRDASGVVVMSLADRGDGLLTFVVGGLDVSAALSGDEAAEHVLLDFARTNQGKALADFSAALVQSTEGASSLAKYVEVFAFVADVVVTADTIDRDAHDFGSYSACDGCTAQCGWCYQAPDWLGGICVGCSCTNPPGS